MDGWRKLVDLGCGAPWPENERFTVCSGGVAHKRRTRGNEVSRVRALGLLVLYHPIDTMELAGSWAGPKNFKLGQKFWPTETYAGP